MGQYKKTEARRSQRYPAHEMPDWVLRFLLPGSVAFSVSEGKTSIVGVSVTRPGPYVEARGKNLDWVLRQASEYLGAIANGQELRIEAATVTRDSYPRPQPEAPWYPAYKRTLCLFYVPGPSVLIPRAHEPAIIVPVKK